MSTKKKSSFWYWTYQVLFIVAFVLALAEIFVVTYPSTNTALTYIVASLVFSILARLERSPY